MYLEGGGIWSVLLLSALKERISKIMYFTSTYKNSMQMQFINFVLQNLSHSMF